MKYRGVLTTPYTGLIAAAGGCGVVRVRLLFHYWNGTPQQR